MFDIGFSEILLIGIVALVVFGPEELPRVARTAGHLMGRLRRYVSDVKADISREIEASEMKGLVAEVQDSARALQSSLNAQAASLQAEFQDLAKPVEDARDDLAKQLDAIAQDATEAAAPDAGNAGAPAMAPPEQPPATMPAVVEEGAASEVDENQLDLFGASSKPDTQKNKED